MEKVRMLGNDELTLLGAVEEYLKDLNRTGRRPATQKNAKLRLAIIANWLLKHYPDIKPATTTLKHLRDYVDFRLAEGKVRASTINTDVSMMHRLFTWLYDEKYIQHNPAEGLKKLEDDKRKTTPYTDDEIAKLLAVTHPKSSHYLTRNHLMQLVLLDCGLRCEELLDLQFCHMRPTNTGGTFTVDADIAKNRESRIVPFGPSVAEELRSYMQLRNKFKELKEEDYIFCNNELEQMTDRAVQQICQEIGDRSGVRKFKRVSAHSYRATFAVNCLRNGMDVYTLMRIGGWKSVEALSPYIKLVNDDLIKAHDTHSPVEMLKRRKDASNNPIIRTRKKRIR